MSDLPAGGTTQWNSLWSRFQAKVVIEESEAGAACWNWTAARDPYGYGRIGIDGRKTRLAHHVSLWLYDGIDPRGRVVMHICDNPSCVNPDHLVVTDHATNVADKVRKKRHAGQAQRGAASPRTVLDDEQADAVRALLSLGYSVASLARIFGCASTNPILAIRNGTRPVTSTTNWKAS